MFKYFNHVNFSMQTQMLFPFVLNFALPQYVADEKPYILNKHHEYLIKTQDAINVNDFLAEHYCNPDSVWYSAEKFREENDPHVQHDGLISKL